MSDLTFSIDLSASKENLLKLLTDYTNFPNYLPHQIKSVIIIEKTDSFIITEDGHEQITHHSKAIEDLIIN